MRPPLLAALVAAAVLAAACGGDRPASATPAPAASVPPAETATPAQAHAKDAPSPPPDSAATATATAAPTPATTASGEDVPGGGGDEAAARVPIELTVQPDGQLAPATVSVPAFLALELTVHNRTGAGIAVTMEGANPGGPLRVASGATASRRLEGLRKGRYAVRAAGAGMATVVVGAEPGP